MTLVKPSFLRSLNQGITDAGPWILHVILMLRFVHPRAGVAITINCRWNFGQHRKKEKSTKEMAEWPSVNLLLVVASPRKTKTNNVLRKFQNGAVFEIS